jgi:hypothetical protein
MTDNLAPNGARAVAFLKLGMQLRTSIAHALEIEEYGVAADLGRIFFALEDGCMARPGACVPRAALGDIRHPVAPGRLDPFRT